jgi:hypothetical protein
MFLNLLLTLCLSVTCFAEYTKLGYSKCSNDAAIDITYMDITPMVIIPVYMVIFIFLKVFIT